MITQATSTSTPPTTPPKSVDEGPLAARSLLASLKNKTATIGVIGLGYVGLPLIDAFQTAGLRTLGFDIDSNKVEELQQGRSYIKHISSERVQSWIDHERFAATADMCRLGEADVLVICVPTPLNESRDPDLSYIRSTSRLIAATLRSGQLIILESTTYPTTTRDVVLPILESAGLKIGEQVFLAYSPEREDPGNPTYSAKNIPKVVGGYNEASLQLACELYSQAVVEVIPVANMEVAEACKILENTYRAVNIALVNELKVLLDRMGINIWEVIDAAKTKPFGFQAFYPGPGLGGHCIPIDPFYLTWLARKHGLSTRFIELAGEVNNRMPEYVISRLIEALNDRGKPIRNSRICVLGVAYKKDVDDPRESPSFVLMELLLQRGANLSYSDPYVPVLPPMRHHHLPAMQSVELTPEFLQAQDAILIATDHSAFDYSMIVEHAQLVIDTRNSTRDQAQAMEHIVRA